MSFQWTSTPHFGHGMTKAEQTRLAQVLQDHSTSLRASTAAHYTHTKLRRAVTPVVPHSGREQPSEGRTGHGPPNSSRNSANLLAR